MENSQTTKIALETQKRATSRTTLSAKKANFEEAS